MEWYRKSAEQGDPRAQFSLANCYFHGHGVEEDATEVVKWMRKAAKQGHAGAQYDLGICYEDGYGVGKNKRKAVEWMFSP